MQLKITERERYIDGLNDQIRRDKEKHSIELEEIIRYDYMKLKAVYIDKKWIQMQNKSLERRWLINKFIMNVSIEYIL